MDKIASYYYNIKTIAGLSAMTKYKLKENINEL